MEVFFKESKIQKMCESHRLMVRAIGSLNARQLQKRLSDLLAAETLEDVTAGHPHPLTGDRTGQFAIELHGGYRLVFTANEPVPYTKDGTIDWRAVTTITIVFIGDYHA